MMKFDTNQRKMPGKLLCIWTLVRLRSWLSKVEQQHLLWRSGEPASSRIVLEQCRCTMFRESSLLLEQMFQLYQPNAKVDHLPTQQTWYTFIHWMFGLRPHLERRLIRRDRMALDFSTYRQLRGFRASFRWLFLWAYSLKSTLLWYEYLDHEQLQPSPIDSIS